MITVYHRLDSDTQRLHSGVPIPHDLELVAVALETNDLDEAFGLTLHDDGDAWTARREILVIGFARGKRSSREGDVFVSCDGQAFVAEADGFLPVAGLHLPFLG